MVGTKQKHEEEEEEEEEEKTKGKTHHHHHRHHHRSRAFVDQCLELHKDEKLTSEAASMAKYWCTDLQSSVADRCVQLHGGWGYMWEYPVARAYADARVQSIYGGSNEIMKELIAREIIGRK